MVRFPPSDEADTEGWARALLTDLAGWPDNATELLEAAWDVENGRVAEWSMNYYEVEMGPEGARITFGEGSSIVSLAILAGVVIEHLGW